MINTQMMHFFFVCVLYPENPNMTIMATESPVKKLPAGSDPIFVAAWDRPTYQKHAFAVACFYFYVA